MNKILKGFGLLTLFFVITGLFGEYVISREVNGYIQLATGGLWLCFNWWLGKMFYKLINV